MNEENKNYFIYGMGLGGVVIAISAVVGRYTNPPRDFIPKEKAAVIRDINSDGLDDLVFPDGSEFVAVPEVDGIHFKPYHYGKELQIESSLRKKVKLGE